ncbi:MAG: short-chain dehydrogenase [Candidatus Rokubacteria bacterium RBG_16_73_20]|nr:MAG: short-chain dehydrogenase [Candidatus Rokubacteria bacterium RBG_16_73_20]HBH01279.1 bifunctional rhamnulose-1-phosphate aldolase/short-chain dehydrogenase [Candidatus Rokubacteria bacterium]
MRSRWNDAEAGSLDGLDLLVHASRLVGAETALVVWGGGNTSIKRTERDHRGREVEVLRVKGSGSDLKSVERKDFPGVRMDDIHALLPREDMGDQEMVAYLGHALQEPGGVRPSIETLLHGFLPARCVVHTHADAIVSLTNNDRVHEVFPAVYGKDVLTLRYLRPGFRISREVADAIAEHPEAKALVLERHGTITWGASVREAYEATIELITGAEAAIAERTRGRRVFGAPRVAALPAEARRAEAVALVPRLRGLLSRTRRVVVTFDDAPTVTEFVGAADAPRLSQVGPATPDHTIYTKRLPCFVRTDGALRGPALAAAVEQAVLAFVRDYTRYVEAHRVPGAELGDPWPRVVLVPGLGMFTAGRDRRTAGIVQDIYHHTIDVIGGASAFGAYVSLSARDAFDVEYWPLELYKLTLAPPEKELARRVALVTGGASGIGRAIARRLAAEGAHVVVGDVDEAGAALTAEEIVAAAGAGRALGVGMDVTREASVRAAFEATLLAYGGLDVLVSNAGTAHSAPVVDLRLEDWERAFAVNATGHFLVAREALRVMVAQGLGGALVFVATKNVMSPGKDFAAYSASKAAEAQLAKVLALEGAPHGIRSNIVNPDAVFQDSRLWSEEIRRERAAAQGIAVGELEEFYRKRNLLGVRVLPEDVAEAALFLASDRSAKTTGCTLTVDGGVKDAFPR